MKPGAYTQLFIQLIFAVNLREKLINSKIRVRVFEYMSAILSEMKHKSIIVNGVSDHVHLLFGLNPAISLSDTVHDLKRSTSLFINTEKLTAGKFFWQEGYGAFSYSKSQLDNVYKYIENQEAHHKKNTFREEYIGFLRKFGIEYDERFLFEFVE